MTFLQELRQATAPLHRELDGGLRLDADVTRDRYGAFLAGTLLVVESLEDALDAPRTRSELLRADLAALRIRPHDPVPDLAPSPTSEGERLGCAYVVEGSALGGLVLARTIEPALALLPTSGTSFLRLRGEDTAAHWRAFLRRLDDFGRDASVTMRAAATRAAIATFDAYKAAFRRTGALAS